MQDQDPTNTPGESGTVEGQPVSSASAPAPQTDEVIRKLQELEEENKKLQYRLTQQGRELKQFKETSAAVSVPQSSEEFDWSNPARAIRQAVRGELTEFQKMQEAERQAQRLRREVAEEFGVPEREMDRYFERLVEAASDPRELAATVARMYRADHADKAIADAAQAAQSTMQRNARGVTSESAATQSMPQQKPIDQMNDKELDEYVMRTYGKAEWPH